MRIYDYVNDTNLATLIKAIFDRPKALNSCGLDVVAATGDQDLKTTISMDYIINGIIYTLAITATIDISATTAGIAATAGTGVQAAGKYAAYLLTVDSGGTIDCLKGADAATDALALAALPAPAANTCPFGIWLVTNTTNPFIAGTTKDSATGVSFTFYNLSDIPSGYGTGAVYLDA